MLVVVAWPGSRGRGEVPGQQGLPLDEEAVVLLQEEQVAGDSPILHPSAGCWFIWAGRSSSLVLLLERLTVDCGVGRKPLGIYTHKTCGRLDSIQEINQDFCLFVNKNMEDCLFVFC